MVVLTIDMHVTKDVPQPELSGCFNPAMVIPVAVVNEGLPVAGIAIYGI